jgi:hypothetical protein
MTVTNARVVATTSATAARPRRSARAVGDVRITVPGDRAGSSHPAVVTKRSRRLVGFDDAVLSLYAKGLTTGDIVNHLADIYGTEVSRDRTNRPVYVAMEITVDGERDVLGLWVGPTGGEGAKQCMSMLTELRNRGVTDACIVCCDGLKGLPDEIAATWPLVTVQDCGAPGPQQRGVCVEGGLGEDHRRAKNRLHRLHRRGGRGQVRGVRRNLARQVPGDDRRLGAVLAGVRAVPGLPDRDPHPDLHHQRDREPELEVPTGGPSARALPDRTGRSEGRLPYRRPIFNITARWTYNRTCDFHRIRLSMRRHVFSRSWLLLLVSMGSVSRRRGSGTGSYRRWTRR